MRPRFLPRPPNMRRVVVVVPSLFTLFNLFFGIWSMVLASRGEFYRASWYIVFAGILDTLDGRVARLSNTGTRFGAELDSLVDIVSFGVAPAFLMYQLEFAGAGQASWIFCYFYVMAAAIRLARFNITQAGRSKSHFVGLPSPAAGMTLATFYPFTQTQFYRVAVGAWPWHLILTFLMIFLTILMVSNVRYATVPKIGFRSARGVIGLLVVLSVVVFGVWRHDVFFFPLGIAYMSYGVLRATLLGFLEGEDASEEADIAGPIVIGDVERVADAYGARRQGIPPRAAGDPADEA
jgi:CDP-diacylglycerol---serine O-phosphatidyltransferase